MPSPLLPPQHGNIKTQWLRGAIAPCNGLCILLELALRMQVFGAFVLYPFGPLWPLVRESEPTYFVGCNGSALRSQEPLWTSAPLDESFHALGLAISTLDFQRLLQVATHLLWDDFINRPSHSHRNGLDSTRRRLKMHQNG